MDSLYRIEELCTNDWNVVDEQSKKLTKEQATQKLEQLLAEGYNPNRLRAVRDN